MQNLSIEREGRRSYFLGDTYPLRSILRNAGANWDPARKAWWMGNKADAEALLEQLRPKAEKAAEDADRSRKKGA